MKQQQNGFTLMELMIAVALVAILTMIAVPSFRGYTERTARATVQGDLAAAASAMERRKSQNFSYKDATAGAGPTDTVNSRSPSDAAAGDEKYTLSIIFLESDGTAIEAGDPVTGYELLAVSTNNFAKGKTEAFKINNMGQKCYKALAAGVSDCTIGTDPGWPNK